ncbi:MAG: DEAD/DEAH box helicase [Promethearchaeota archaeon]|jgi:superfamily II DNA or RNA helicase
MLLLKVGNVFTDIEGDLPLDLYRKLQRNMSFRPEGYEFSTMYNRWILDDQGKRVRRMWDGWRRQIWKSRNGKRIYFPTGLFSIVKIFLDKHKITHTCENCRVKPQRTLNLSLNPELKLRDYQDTVASDSAKQQRGIIQVATGGGKTIIAGSVIERLGVSPFIFFVTSIDLLTQAKSSLEDSLRLDGKPFTVGQIGGGKIDIRDINVMTVQTAVRAAGKEWSKDYKFDADDVDDKTPIEQHKTEIHHLLKTAAGALCDEVQHWRAETCQLVARSLESAYYTYGSSATPYRDEGDDLMIHACFGKKIAQIEASQLIRDKWLVKPSIKIVHVRGEKSSYRQWQQLYKDQVTDNDQYNKMIASIANSYIQNGRLVLILVQQIKHGKTIASLVPESIFLSGDSSKKKREDNVTKLRNREISCIVSTNIFDEGIDVCPLDTVILAGQGKSKVRAMQRIGRIMRPFKGKETATAIDFRIHQKYLFEHSIQREKMYRTEEEYDIEEIDPDG